LKKLNFSFFFQDSSHYYLSKHSWVESHQLLKKVGFLTLHLLKRMGVEEKRYKKDLKKQNLK